MRLFQFKDEFEKYRNTSGTQGQAKNVAGIANSLRQKLSRSLGRTITRAVERQEMLSKLAKPVNQRISRYKNQTKLFASSSMEAMMLKSIIDIKAQEHRQDPLYFSSHAGLQDVVDAFELLTDYYFGKLHDNITELIELYGLMLLSDDEKEEYKQVDGDDAAKKEWIGKHTKRKVLWLWHFMVSLCRIFQSEDHPLTPIDAYWLGLADEVPGSDLPCVRWMMESIPPPPPKKKRRVPRKDVVKD